MPTASSCKNSAVNASRGQHGADRETTQAHAPPALLPLSETDRENKRDAQPVILAHVFCQRLYRERELDGSRVKGHTNNPSAHTGIRFQRAQSSAPYVPPTSMCGVAISRALQLEISCSCSSRKPRVGWDLVFPFNIDCCLTVLTTGHLTFNTLRMRIEFDREQGGSAWGVTVDWELRGTGGSRWWREGRSRGPWGSPHPRNPQAWSPASWSAREQSFIEISMHG